MSSQTLTVLDPTSLLGREVAEHFARSWPEARRQYFHTAGTEEHLIAEVGGEAALVPPLTDTGELGGTRAVIATAQVPPEIGSRLTGWLRANPLVTLLDLTHPGLAPEESRLGVPPPTEPAQGRRWFKAPHPALAGPLRVIRALSPLAPVSCHLAVVVPVSEGGQDALEELAAQGAARLSGGTPKPPNALPAVLAFDLLPGTGEAESELERQMATSTPGLQARVSTIHAGVFHGHVAAMHVTLGRPAREETARALLRDADGIRVARRNERIQPSGVVGSDEVVCATLRVAGVHVSVSIVADGLRTGALRAAADLVELLTAS
ncbi:MAG: Asd/ArgC dimerization domain-containing protein [Acidobacteriota bacterium]